MAKRSKLMSVGFASAQTEGMVGEAGSIVMAGSTSADATKITTECVLVTTSSAGGAILPASDKGDTYLIKNEGGADLALYPPSGATINATTSLTVANAKSVVIFFSSTTKCHSIPTVAS